MKIYVNTHFLAMFLTRQNPYDLSSKQGKSYGWLHTSISKYEKLGLIRQVASKPAKKNPKIMKGFFEITQKGLLFLELFDPELAKVVID